MVNKSQSRVEAGVEIGKFAILEEMMQVLEIKMAENFTVRAKDTLTDEAKAFLAKEENNMRTYFGDGARQTSKKARDGLKQPVVLRFLRIFDMKFSKILTAFKDKRRGKTTYKWTLDASLGFLKHSQKTGYPNLLKSWAASASHNESS